MTRKLRHRGPDGEDFFADEKAALGHRRLAIIDRASGNQPMANEDRSCWVVFNGEIYNHRVLRRELIGRGHTFRTSSDTETILHAYEEYGTACVEHFEGMFAFAIYDRHRRELFMARDRLGKKPLFYAVLAGTLHFASEIKALYRSPVWDGTLDLSALEGYLSLGYFVAPHTVYRAVRKLEPGHWLRVRDGRVEIRKYWDVVRFDEEPQASDRLVTEAEELLRTVVHERLESEVPLGAFLSGGIDSGLVVSFMSEKLGRALVTTSVGFQEMAHNELKGAALTARQFETQHYADLVEPQLDDVLDTIVGAFDEPFADSSAVPTYYVSASARRHVTVALSGDGGDETFGGYGFRYAPHAVESAARPLIPHLARPAISWVGAHWPRSRHLAHPLRLGTSFENIGRDEAAAYFADLCVLKPYAARTLLGLAPNRDARDSPVYDAVTEPYRRCPSTSPTQRAQYADLKMYLPNDVLVKVDRMSMCHGLEVRSPLLDRRVVEFAFRLSSSAKTPWLRPKHFLRRIARKRLPRELLNRPKHGFTAPVGSWITRSYANMFREDIFNRKSTVSTLLDLDYLQQAFDEHRQGLADHSYMLWAAWVLERWSQLQQTAAPRDEVAQVVVR